MGEVCKLDRRRSAFDSAKRPSTRLGNVQKGTALIYASCAHGRAIANCDASNDALLVSMDAADRSTGQDGYT